MNTQKTATLSAGEIRISKLANEIARLAAALGYASVQVQIMHADDMGSPLEIEPVAPFIVFRCAIED